MTFFSTSYQEACQRFKQTASAVGATLKSLPLHNDYEIDIALWGEQDKPTLIVTSGLHGVEGFFGSAVQLAAMEKLQRSSELDTNLNEFRFVFVHAINPYGFENIRRVDENNVDLNRNFLFDEQAYQGAPSAYENLDEFLNPKSPASLIELYPMVAALNLLRYGKPALKEAIVTGQYQYPEGIFYGGGQPSAVTAFVKQHCDDWVGTAEQVAHIDLHSGLGTFGEYKILLSEHHDDHGWYTDTFGEKSVASLQSSDKIAYSVKGGMGAWLQRRFSDRQYYFAGAEFGTYNPVRVVGALRSENRAYHYASPQSDSYRKAKIELLECFCPASEQWRTQVVDSSMTIISSALHGLRRSSAQQTLG